MQSMKSFRKELWFNVPSRRGFVNITREVEECVQKSGVWEGLCLVNAMHITASVFVNDDERGLLGDIEVWLEKLAPHEPIQQYRHNDTGEDNADAHIKRQVMGREVTLADVCVVPQVTNARRLKVPLERFPKIVGVDRACLALPAFDRARPENQPDAE